MPCFNPRRAFIKFYTGSSVISKGFTFFVGSRSTIVYVISNANAIMAIQDATRTPSGGSQNRSSASEPGTPSAFYKAHLAESITLLSTLQQQIRNIALLRLVTGVAIFLTIYRLFRTFGSPLWWMILMLLFTLFIFLPSRVTVRLIR